MASEDLPQQLRGAYGKLERAREGIDVLAKEMREYLRTAGYRRVRREIPNGYLDTVVGPPVPDRFPILIGEVAHHLRSALDHLVWQLILQNTQREGTTRSEFPIYRTPPENSQQRRQFAQKIDGVREDAAEAIRKLQPFENPPADVNPLWIVHHLDGIDKHRILLTVVAVAHLHPSRKIGADRAMLRAPIGTPKSDAQINEGFSVEIRLNELGDSETEGGPPAGAVPALAYLAKFIESVLGLFHPAFKGS